MLWRTSKSGLEALRLTLALLVGLPLAAAAQTPAPLPATPPQDPFVLQSGDGANRLIFGLNVQFDGRFSLDTPPATIDTFTIRKVRPTLTGRVGQFFDFKVMPDFGSGAATLPDAYFDIRFSPKFRVRTGKDKTPVGYELLICDGCLLFPERSLASGLVPNRDVGVQAQGELRRGTLSYSAGVFNGVADGTSSTTEVDINSGKDVAGRIVARFANGAGVHLGASTGTQTGALPSFRTSVGQTYFAYGTGVTADGRRTRFSPAVFYYRRGIGVFAEYMRSEQTVRRVSRVDVAHRGWDVTGSIVLTGETASDRIVRPKHPFNPAAGHWGALQLLMRYSAVTFDPLAFTEALTVAGASPGARSLTIAANWYPAAYVKYYLTFERTTFSAGATTTRPAENVILVRAQLAF